MLDKRIPYAFCSMLAVVACGQSDNGVDASTAEAGSEAGADAGIDSPIHVACPAPKDAEVVAQLPANPTGGLVATGGALYVGLRDWPNPNDATCSGYPPAFCSGRIARVARSGGALTTFASNDYISGMLATDGTDLFFLRGACGQDLYGYHLVFGDVLATPTGGPGALRVIAQAPQLWTQAYELFANGAQGVAWMMKSTAAEVIQRWDGSAVTGINTPNWADAWIADAANVYAVVRLPDLTNRQEQLLKASLSSLQMPFASGGWQLLAGPWPNFDGHVLAAQDDSNLYVHSVGGITAISKVDGTQTALTGPVAVIDYGIDPGVPSSAVAFTNASWLYFVSTDRRSTIQRIPTSGGAPEDFYTASSDIASMTADECGIYWTTSTNTLMRKSAD